MTASSGTNEQEVRLTGTHYYVLRSTIDPLDPSNRIREDLGVAEEGFQRLER